jgi:hypothetical protein
VSVVSKFLGHYWSIEMFDVPFARPNSRACAGTPMRSVCATVAVESELTRAMIKTLKTRQLFASLALRANK